MTLPRATMMELMAYADGELDDDTRARVEELLATNAEARGVAEALGALGEDVREAVLGRVIPRADGIADAVMKRLGGHGPVDADMGKRDGPVGRTGGAHSLPAGASVAQVLPIGTARQVRVAIAAAAVSALALAAGYAFVVRSAVDKLGAPAPAPLASAEAPDGTGQGVEVEQLDSPDRSVSMMYLPAVAAAANANASTVVVWITDEQASGDQ